MKIEQFEPGFYRIRDIEGYAMAGIVVGGYGRWQVRLEGVTTTGFKTKKSAIAFLICRTN